MADEMHQIARERDSAYIAKLEAENEALQATNKAHLEFRTWAQEQVHRWRTGRAVNIAQIIGVADRCDYVLSVMTEHQTPDGLVIRVALPKVRGD